MASSFNASDDTFPHPRPFGSFGSSERQFEPFGRNQDKPMTVLMIGLDRFEKINESFGYRIGDLLLQSLESRLRKVTASHLFFNRCGGAEFIVILPDGSLTETTLMANEILRAVHRPFRIEEYEMGLVARIGVAVSHADENDPHKVAQRARIALSAAKNAHNDYVFYSREQGDVKTQKTSLTADLRQAINEDQLFLLYQPKIDLESGRVTGVEALVRWQHPQLGIVLPDQFIPLAEETGMITQLTHSVSHKVLQQCQAWTRGGMRTTIAMNLSMWDLQDNDFADRMSGLLSSYGVSPSQIALEVTETAVMNNASRVIDALNSMRKMGLWISIDDFGTGYSSLAYLKNLPVNEIKIDRSFVTKMSEDKKDTLIVQSIIDLAHKFGLKVVAEGVEDRKTKEMLENLNCDTAQGYYISRPVSPIEFRSWLSTREWGISQQILESNFGKRWLGKLLRLNPSYQGAASI